MIRKVSKAELDRLATAGVKIKRRPPPPPSKPQEIQVTIPESLLAPLVDALRQTLDLQRQTQADIAQALNQFTASRPVSVQVTERDNDGNISRLNFIQPTRH